MKKSSAEFRFYQELNDFLPKKLRNQSFIYPFSGKPTVKDAIESLGVPHTEVDLILINEKSVAFHHHLKDQDRVAVYPTFESLEIGPIVKLRPKALRETRFITDVHLGRLTRYLRMLGFDTAYDTSLKDPDIIKKAVNEKRIVLTRDLGILKNKKVTHGYFLRNTEPKLQAKEVLNRFDLKEKIKPFSRCLECNTPLMPIEKEAIERFLLPETKESFETYFQCPGCLRIYWEGSHFDRMLKTLNFISS